MRNSLIQFTKMHGLGNDFVIINALYAKPVLNSSEIAALANRHTGIGFDQLLVLETSERSNYFCRIFNADGSEAEQCGNGLRCIARFIHEEKIDHRKHLLIETKAGAYPCEIKDYEHIRIALGIPKITNPIHTLSLPIEARATHAPQETNHTVPMTVLSLGNPHAIVKLDSIQQFPLEDFAKRIASLSDFPLGVNVGFMQVMDEEHIQLRTFERGVGETCACGSNACAAVVTGIYHGWLKQRVNVTYRYGSLLVEWEGENRPLNLTGPASRVYTGHFARD